MRAESRAHDPLHLTFMTSQCHQLHHLSLHVVGERSIGILIRVKNEIEHKGFESFRKKFDKLAPVSW